MVEMPGEMHSISIWSLICSGFIHLNQERGEKMVTKDELCKKIEAIHPHMGVCGIDFNVDYDDKAEAWAVDYHQGKRHLRTFVDFDEADSCLEKEKCLPLGLQIGQLRNNFEKYIHEHALEKDN